MITLQHIERKDKPILEGLLIAYFQEIDATKIIVQNGTEILNYPYLDTYWTDANRVPLFVLFHTEIIGFVLINDWIVHRESQANRSIAEFYIQPTHRRQGIGQQVANEIFDKYGGKWEIRQDIDNIGAVKFWRTVIASYTKGSFEEIENTVDEAVFQLFKSSNYLPSNDAINP